MRKLVLFSILLALTATPAYAKGNSHSGGSSSHSGHSGGSSSSHSGNFSSSSSSKTGNSTSGIGSHSSTTSTTDRDHTTLSSTQDNGTKELDNRFKHAETLQTTELKNYADQLKNSLTQEATKPERGKYFSRLSELYEKSGDLSSAIETKEQELQTDYTSLKKLSELYSKAGNTEVNTFINGHKAHFDTPPVIKDGHTVIPIRGVSESLKADVKWDPDAQSITIKRDETTIVLTVGSNTATINGQSVTLDASSTIMNGRAFVPLRFVSQALKAQVNWVDGVINIEDGSTTSDTTDPSGDQSENNTSGEVTPTGDTTSTPTDSSEVTPPTNDTNLTDQNTAQTPDRSTNPSSPTDSTSTSTVTDTSTTADNTGTSSTTDTAAPGTEVVAP